MISTKIISSSILVTQKAAWACFDHIGGQNPKQADQAATQAMREAFQYVPMDGSIVIGEGERDEAPMLYIGEKVGRGSGWTPIDIAVDPLEGTGLCARGENGSLCVLALAHQNCLLHAPDVYMDKLACGKKLKGHLHLQNSPTQNIKIACEILNCCPKNLKVALLKRSRHQSLIKELKSCGVEPILFEDGDVEMSFLTAIHHPSSIDLLLGSGGAPEGVLSAVGLKNLDGDFQGKLLWSHPDQKKRAVNMGVKNADQILQRDDLIQGEGVLIATGVTHGCLVKGVKIKNNQACFETLVLINGSLYGEKNQRVIQSHHPLSHQKILWPNKKEIL